MPFLRDSQSATRDASLMEKHDRTLMTEREFGRMQDWLEATTAAIHEDAETKERENGRPESDREE